MKEKIIFLLRSVAECLEICVADELEEEKTKKYLNKKTTNRYDTYASLVIQCTCHKWKKCGIAFLVTQNGS